MQYHMQTIPRTMGQVLAKSITSSGGLQYDVASDGFDDSYTHLDPHDGSASPLNLSMAQLPIRQPPNERPNMRPATDNSSDQHTFSADLLMLSHTYEGAHPGTVRDTGSGLAKRHYTQRQGVWKNYRCGKPSEQKKKRVSKRSRSHSSNKFELLNKLVQEDGGLFKPKLAARRRMASQTGLTMKEINNWCSKRGLKLEKSASSKCEHPQQRPTLFEKASRDNEEADNWPKERDTQAGILFISHDENFFQGSDSGLVPHLNTVSSPASHLPAATNSTKNLVVNQRDEIRSRLIPEPANPSLIAKHVADGDNGAIVRQTGMSVGREETSDYDSEIEKISQVRSKMFHVLSTVGVPIRDSPSGSTLQVTPTRSVQRSGYSKLKEITDTPVLNAGTYHRTFPECRWKTFDRLEFMAHETDHRLYCLFDSHPIPVNPYVPWTCPICWYAVTRSDCFNSSCQVFERKLMTRCQCWRAMAEIHLEGNHGVDAVEAKCLIGLQLRVVRDNFDLACPISHMPNPTWPERLGNTIDHFE